MPDYDTPEFLSCAMKSGLLSPNADALTAYQLHGFLIRDEFFRQRRLKQGLTLPFDKILKTLSPAEMLALRERVLGVLPFQK